MIRPFAAAAEQNKTPIAEVLAEVLAEAAEVLEIGSGTGQHAAFFAGRFPHLAWQPSDLADALPGIEAWRRAAGAANLRPPLALDVAERPWPSAPVDAVYSANTAHIMAWPQVESMILGAAEVLRPGGLFCLYGPFHYGGRPTSDSNARFDQDLRRRDPASGVRDFDDLDRVAADAGLRLLRDYPMPANNRLLVWRRD